MLTVFSDLQRTHRTEYIVIGGKRTQSHDALERVDSILSAISKRESRSVIAPDDVGLEPVHAVHDEGMIQYLATAYTRSCMDGERLEPVFPDYFPPSSQRRRPGCFKGQKGFYCTDMETPIDRNTWDAVLASAHCAWTGATRLHSGASCVYALCRPPGHHAGPNFFGGYCYLNNAAIAAGTLSDDGERVAILDIDYHHGSGIIRSAWRYGPS